MVGLSNREIALRVEGRVQGVGFRSWTQSRARHMGVRGWVQNRPDGTVEVHAAAAGFELDEFVRQLHEGPRGARVDRVITLGPCRDLPAVGFEIRGD